MTVVTPRPRHGAETILIVEDEPRVRTVIRRMLERLGYTVHDAATGAEALSLAETLPEPPDLLLADMVMPGQSGPALAKQLRARWPGLRVLFMSAHTDDELLRRGLFGFAMLFLEKPFTADLVARAVRRALDGDHPTQASAE
jgi:CheY-like chemotaxis protein